jgi:hypothetical protein
MYILPPYRFTVYSFGLLLGYLLRTEKNRRLTKAQLNFGWFLATVGVLVTLLLTSVMSVFNYKFSSVDAALYASIAPIPWCFFFAWIIFTSQLGYKKSKRAFQDFHQFILHFVNRFSGEIPLTESFPDHHETFIRHLSRPVCHLPFQHWSSAKFESFRHSQIAGKYSSRFRLVNICFSCFLCLSSTSTRFCVLFSHLQS